jgi:hypothetical protein
LARYHVAEDGAADGDADGTTEINEFLRLS